MPLENQEGFNLGELHLEGVDSYKGDAYKIWYKNENQIAYKNDKVHITCPI